MPFLSSLDRDGNVLGEEVPVTNTPIFEGHLSVRTEKKHWQWRLFRFDGSNFTCLSTRKVKLPPHTKEQQQDTSSYSLTSPLLATPKDKNKRLTADGTKTELKYYQLPEWTIDVVNISSISVLKRAKKNNILPPSPSKCFSIRTFQGQCFILKAQKQKDLERWLFVLTKMWKFTQAVKDQVLQQQQQQQFYYNTTNAQQQQAQAQVQQAAAAAVVDDNIPLVHSIQQQPTYDIKYRAPTLSDEKIRVIEEWRKSLAELMASDPCIKIFSPPPIEPITDDDTMSVFTDMTSVSNRPKSLKRRTDKSGSRRSGTTTSRSLRRNKTNSIAPQQSQEMPLEGRPVPTLRKRRSDDVRNWMNNNSNNSAGGGRPSLSLNRAASIGSNRKPMIQKLNTAVQPLAITTTQNYYYPSTNNNASVSTSPEIIHHNMNFFQDVVTVCDDETCNNHHHQGNTTMDTLRYHTSIRGKKLIQVNQGGDEIAVVSNGDDNNKMLKEERSNNNNNKQDERGEAAAATAVLVEEKQQQQEEQGVNINNTNNDDTSTSPNQKSSRSTKTIIRRASMPLTNDNLLLQQQYQQYHHQQQQQQQKLLFDQQQINSLQSPLQFLSMTKEVQQQKEEEEEEMSLADLQKSLRQVGLHNRSPSASSIQDLQKRQIYYYNNNNNPPSIVAPAIPPHQFHQHHHHIIPQQQQQLYLFDTAYYDQKKFLPSTSADNKKVLMNHDISSSSNNNYNIYR